MEPEIVNVVSLLNNMGARISGAGTSKITIVGVDRLHGANIETIHSIFPPNNSIMLLRFTVSDIFGTL